MKKESIAKAIGYYQTEYEGLFQEFIDFLKIPSISTSDKHKGDILTASEFLVKKLNDIGFDRVEAIQTDGHPIVFGERARDPQKPTILLYGHYDVQPPDPIAEWVSAPFEPQVRDDYLFARGSSDMKGQIWALISALQSILETGDLKVNIKVLFEGEEEIGSPSLDKFLEDYKDTLKCDLVLNTDAGMLAEDKPTVTYALRGLAYFELRVKGPKADLHSGLFGGVIDNPANVLCRVVAKMHDEKGRVTLPGFYDRVRPLSKEESEGLAQIGVDEAFYLSLSGAPALSGEEGFEPIELTSARPTLDINGIYSGYIDEGAKTIIPSYALAKISCRLVPDQNPDEIHQSMIKFLEKHVPNTVDWELDYLSGAPAYLAEDDVPGLKLFENALETIWGKKPLKKREGGSIPVATSMKEILGVDSIITGFGLPGDQVHSPNERMHLPTHKNGVKALINFFLSF
ncbi:MAG: dipeptidase [Brevefilum sp.]|jgi:acetylornithine deacetylase/succinyl-diaminopimelate desuccinylase-like protein